MRKAILLIGTLLIMLLTSCSSGDGGTRQYRVGVSQCSGGIWREKQNREMAQELLLTDGITMELRCADDQAERQIEDIQYFIDQQVDLLIVSPYEASAVTPIITRAYNQGIPVVVFDRRPTGDKYTAFVSGDNVEAGRLLADYALSQCPQGGKVLELMGSRESSPAQLRHSGVLAALAAHPELQLVATIDARWSGAIAASLMDSLLTLYPDVDVVMAHSDWMAFSAKAAAGQARPGNKIRFVGVDGLVGPGEGIEAIQEGREDASATYPTGGHVIMRTAINILRGEPYQREQLLESHLIASPEEASLTASMQRAIDREAENVQQLRDRADHFSQLDELHRHELYVVIAFLLLVLGLAISLFRMYRFKKRANESLTRQRTLLREQRDQLLTMTHQLEEATHAKLSFFTNISHDFRTPLTLIEAPVDRLIQKFRSASTADEDRRMLQLAKRNVHVLKHLVNQILDFQKAESGKMELNLRPVDVLEETRLWVDSFQGLAAKQGVTLELVIDGAGGSMHNAPFTTLADRRKLERIFYNLVGNAFKYTPAGGAITVTLSRACDNITMSIADTGPGIDEEHIQRIFESYYMVDASHHEGTGLGLSLAKTLVELHGGTIEAANRTDCTGTVFTFRIPMREVPEGAVIESAGMMSERVTTEQESLQKVEEGEDLTVADDEPRPIALVIDDNDDIRLLLRTLLADSYRVLSAADGSEGLRKAEEVVPDIIVCDVMMPVMDGLECCRRLKSGPTTSHIPVLMLTACSLDEQRIRGLEEGADAYIAKPFNSGVLLAQMETLIKNHVRVKDFYTASTAPLSSPLQGEGILSQPEGSATEGNNQSSPLRGDKRGAAGAAGAPSLSPYDQEFLAKLHRYIDQHLSDEDYSVELLASDVCLSRTQLFRKCKALTGESPVELIRNTRLRVAQRLLEEGKGSVAEVSSLVGFSDSSYFSKCYKAYFGTSPHDVIKQKY